MDQTQEIQDLREKVSKIFYFISRHGVDTMFKGQAPTEDFDKDELNRLVFDGFKQGQKLILKELIELQSRIKKLRSDLKEARKNKSKDDEKLLTYEIGFLEYQADIFKNLADAIVWQLINGQHYILRRLYTHETGEKDLSSTSFQAVIHHTDEVNKDRETISIISDITNNIHLGDCLVVNKQGISIVEIKTGEVNSKAILQIHDEGLTKETFKEEDFKNKTDEKYAQQIKRMLEQMSKNKKAADILTKGSGVDPKFPNVFVTIPEEIIQIETYHDKIFELIKKLDNKDYAYDCIEAVVHIGVYKNRWVGFGKETLEEVCKPFPVHDLMSSRGIAICEPIFCKPLPEEVILDLVTSKIKIYIGIDFEKLIEFSNFLGIPARWSTPKEVAKLLTSGNYNPKEIFSFENKGIFLKDGEKEAFVAQGFLVKIMFDHFLPSSMLLMEGKN